MHAILKGDYATYLIEGKYTISIGYYTYEEFKVLCRWNVKDYTSDKMFKVNNVYYRYSFREAKVIPINLKGNNLDDFISDNIVNLL